MGLKEMLGKFWKIAMLIVFGVSFVKDVILICAIVALVAVGMPLLIVCVSTIVISFLLNAIGYKISS